MNPVILVALGVGGFLYLMFRGTASPCDNFCNQSQLDSCGKYSLSDGAIKIAWAMAGFETGTREYFSPYDSTTWQGSARQNNNPLNIRGINGEFNSYESPEAGFAAGINDIEHKIMGFTVTGLNSGSSIAQLVAVWSPQSCKGNAPGSTSNYADFVSAQVGVDKNAPFNSFIEVA